MGQYKPMGMDRKQFLDAQEKKSDEDFRFNTNQRIQDLQFAIDKLNKTLGESIADKGSEKVAFNNSLSAVSQSMWSRLKDFEQHLDRIQKDIFIHESMFKVMDNKYKDVVTEEYLNKELTALEKMLSNNSKQIEAQSNEFRALIKSLSQEFESKLKKQREEILGIPSEIPQLKKEFNQKLELVELNGQNAILRSSNNERQLSLIEKKIENIYQLMKKFDLTKQETL